MLTADNTADATGFKIAWTEILPLSADGKSGVLFHYCIRKKMLFKLNEISGNWSGYFEWFKFKTKQ